MFQKDVSSSYKNTRRRNGKGDKKYFSKAASGTRRENIGGARPMRGGIRL